MQCRYEKKCQINAHNYRESITVTAGVATTVNGVSELGEAITGHNYIRDKVFRGNSKAYNTYAHTRHIIWRSKKMNKKFFVNPYVFSMWIILMIMYPGLCIFVINKVVQAQPDELWRLVKYLGIPFAFSVTIMLFDSYQQWGQLMITKDALEIHAFPRRKIRLEFDEIQFMGIDYGNIDTGAQFWLYFTDKENVAEIIKHRHQMIKVRYKQGIIKCVYRKEVYDVIRESFPGRLRKDLERCCEGAIREYKLNKE